jgi:cytochrome b561
MSVVDRVRRWARTHTDDRHYSPVGITFHWTAALLIVVQLYLGFTLNHAALGEERLGLYPLHAAIGIVIALLAALRVVWRTMIPGPVTAPDQAPWERWLAHATHYAFYFAFFAMPLTGWIMWSAPDAPYLIGAGDLKLWPNIDLTSLDRAARVALYQGAAFAHGAMAFALIGLIGLHAAAAIKHHFVEKNQVLTAMAPILEAPEPDESQKDRPQSAHPPPA